MASMKSPGIYFNELDLSSYVATLSNGMEIGIAGYSRNGSVYGKTLFTTLKSYLDNVGNPIDYSGLAAVAVLKAGGSVWWSRAYKPASTELADSDYKTANLTESLKIRFRNPGTIDDNTYKASITITGDSPKVYTLSVVQISNAMSTVVLDEEVSLKSTDDNFLGTYKDDTFEIINSGTGDITLSESIADKEFSGGNDGSKDTAYSALISAINRFNDPEGCDASVVIAPAGAGNGEVAAALINVCESRKDCIAIVDPESGLDPSEVVEWVKSNTSSTSYAAVYHPWVKISNPYFKNDKEFVPPSVVMAAAYVRCREIENPWSAPAGLKRVTLGDIIDVPDNGRLTKENRDVLYEGRVNPIINYKSLGYTAFGQKTLLNENKSTNRVNVRLLCNYIKKIGDRSTTKYLFEPITEIVMGNWRTEMDDVLKKIKTKLGVYDYKVEMGFDTTVSAANVKNNEMPGIISIKPTKTAEFIPITVVLKNIDDEM